MKAIILAAGLGSRLRKITKKNHKSLIKVGNQTILERLIYQLESSGVKKINIISRGDDYQILFTANHIKSRIIKKMSKITGVKITKIGKIISGKNKSEIINEKNKQIEAKNKGYIHHF